MSVIEGFLEQARARRRRVVLPEGGDPRVLAAARRLQDEGIAQPVLIDEGDAEGVASAHGVDLRDLTRVNRARTLLDASV